MKQKTLGEGNKRQGNAMKKVQVSELTAILKNPAAVRINILRGNIARPAGLLDISEVQCAVEAEPELPGEMPDEVWNAIRKDRSACAEVLRITVRQTKTGILARIYKLLGTKRDAHELNRELRKLEKRKLRRRIGPLVKTIH